MRIRGAARSRTDAAARSDDAEVARLRARYLDLVKAALTHLLYRPLDFRFEDAGYVDTDEDMRAAALAEFAKPDFAWVDVRADGRDWPRYAQTMVGTKRLDNVQHCVERVLADGVPGDLIETGVWRGGVIILMRAILDAFGDHDRVVFAADSFRGLPEPADVYPADAKSRLHQAEPLAVSRADVEQNISLYGLLDDNVQFLEGWFKDTLPTLAGRKWSVARLDGDMYGSTMDALTNLYPNLSPGGFLIVDDYTFEPCKQAVSDYRDAHAIREPIEMIDWLGAFWRRES
jgi:O-methyltransferase